MGRLLFYERDVDMTLLVVLSTKVSAQDHGTEATTRAMVKLLNYCATYQDTVIWYKQNEMILETHSDASYLSDTKERSQACGQFFLTKITNQVQHMINNGVVNTVFTTICNVMSSAAESEIAALYLNERDIVIIWDTLEEMSHPQISPTYIVKIPHQKAWST